MNNEELILGYFKNTLTPQEQEKVKLLLLNDNAFKEEFEEYKAVRTAFKINEANALKVQLKTLEAKTNNTRPNTKQILTYAIAAAGVALVGMTIFFNLNTRSLYSEYYKTYPNVYKPVVRGSSNDQLGKAFVYYENKDYKMAKNEFDSLLATESNPDLVFYYGLTLLELNDYDEAIQQFETITNDGFQFKEELLWYSALAYIEIESYKKARKQLYVLSKMTSSAFHENATELLEDLPED